jgi:TusE/DsrC/DsvC family sulfur relay protein
MTLSTPLPALDGEGYLVEPQDWTEGLAEEFARQENIQLSADHWDAIRFMRQFSTSIKSLPMPASSSNI